MFSKIVVTVAFAAGLVATHHATGADTKDLAQIRDEIRQIRDEYEARIRALESRLQAAEARAGGVATRQPLIGAAVPQQATAGSATVQQATAVGATVQQAAAGSATAQQATASAPTAVPAAKAGSQANIVASTRDAPASGNTAGARGNAFNPAISMVIGGSYARLSKDPEQYRIQGFIPGGEEVGPGSRSFNLGESELTLSASIDHRFSGQLTFALGAENEVSVEEAFFRTHGLAHGVNLKAGRFLSGIGYLNGQHAHTWDFADAPLAYKAFFGGQYRNDGIQARWLAPIDTFVELGIEAGRGSEFPGTVRNRNGFGSTAAFVNLGGDIGASLSWRAGASYLHSRAADRSYEDIDQTGIAVTNAYSGTTRTWIADGVLKWAPMGNATQTSFKLQGEYFRRSDRGTLTYDTSGQSLGTVEGKYAAKQSGYYVQGVYQFMPQWRIGLRYDKLHSGTPAISSVDDGILAAADFAKLLSYNPARSTAMIDYSPSEFSRFRVQFARDQARPGVTDNQIFLQYIMSLGAHGAHAF